MSDQKHTVAGRSMPIALAAEGFGYQVAEQSINQRGTSLCYGRISRLGSPLEFPLDEHQKWKMQRLIAGHND